MALTLRSPIGPACFAPDSVALSIPCPPTSAVFHFPKCFFTMPGNCLYCLCWFCVVVVGVSVAVVACSFAGVFAVFVHFGPDRFLALCFFEEFFMNSFAQNLCEPCLNPKKPWQTVLLLEADNLSLMLCFLELPCEGPPLPKTNMCVLVCRGVSVQVLALLLTPLRRTPSARPPKMFVLGPPGLQTTGAKESERSELRCFGKQGLDTRISAFGV